MKKKIFITIISIIIVLITTIGYIVVQDLKQEELLKQEIVNLSNKDLLKDDYTTKVKTKGDYAYVEEAIKKFYKELSDNVKTVKYYLNNEDIQNILTPENLEKERPTFKKSYNLLDDVSKKSAEAINTIAELCEEEKIKSLIDKEKVDNYYIDLYKELMYTKEDLKEFQEIKTNMQILSNNLKQFLNKEKEILEYLEKNNSSWIIKDEQIYFSTNEQVEEYNKLYQELVDISKKFENEEIATTNKSNNSI